MSMKPVLHASAGVAAMLLIASFWISTLVSELFMDRTAVVAVKHAVLYGLFLLVPFMAATGISGVALGRLRQGLLVDRKKRRMAIIAANGLLVMIPAAIYLYRKAAAGNLDLPFYALQAVELAVGAVQLALMAMNLRDGIKLAGRLRPRARRSDDSGSGDTHKEGR